LNDLKDDIELLKKYQRWIEFALRASQAKILGVELDLSINSSEWADMKRSLGWILDGDESSVAIFAGMASNMAILAAKEVIVDEHGLTLIKAEPAPNFENRDVPLPEIKKF
jgi:hypothetical protein